MTRPILVFAAALAACSNQPRDRDGTFVGNPGKLGVAAIDVDARLQLDAVVVAVVGLEVHPCDAPTVIDEAPVTLDALGGGAVLDLPGGDLCGLTLVLDATTPVVVDGATDGGTTFTAVLDPGALVLDEVVRVDGDALLVALSLDALDPTALEALGADVAIGPGDPAADAAALGIAGALTLYEDTDIDGQIDQDPPAALDAMSADSGCGCAAGPAAPTPWWPLSVLSVSLWFKRRRSPLGAGRPARP